MPPRRARNPNPNPNNHCMQPECVSTRQRFGTMCAARACAQKALDRLETEMRLAAMRNGGNGEYAAGQRRVEPGGDPATVRENMHILKERIRAVRALIEKINTAPDVGSDEVLVAIEARIAQLEARLLTAEDEEIGALVESYQTLQAEASKRRVEKQPLECGICLEAITPDTLMMGKNCTHLFCMQCIAGVGFSRVKPGLGEPQRDTNPYWEHVGHAEEETINGPSVVHQYRLRPEYVEEDGVTYKGFPADTWVRCPECRDPHYADAPYFGMCKQAMDTIDQDEVEPQAPKQPQEVVDEMVEEDLLLLLDAPKAEGYGGPDLILAVEAKIPGTADNPNFLKGPALGAQLRMLGFAWDRADKTGGNGWTREKRFDDVVRAGDYRGGQLTKTAATRKRKMVDIEPGPDGQRRQEEQSVLQGGGTWKFAYPRPPPVIAAAEAGPSGEDPAPLAVNDAPPPDVPEEEAAM